MASFLKKIVGSKFVERTKRKVIAKSGLFFSLKKLSPSTSDDLALVKILNTFKFDKVLDVGANIGQFAESLIDFGYKGKIISFEPTSVVYHSLKKKSERKSNWTVAEKMAIGNADDVIEINISSNPLFNSIKEIDSDYTDYNADSGKMDSETVRIAKIDSIWNEYVTEGERVFLKIDTQGFEKEVLDGATNSLENVSGIKIEMALQPIYKNVEWDVFDLMNFFKGRGFTCVGISKVAVNQQSGIVHEVDGVFIKESLLKTS